MARSLGTLTIDLLLKAGAFESDSGRAARIAERDAKAMARSFDAAGKAIGLALAAGITTVGAAVVSAINHMDDLSKAAQRANMPTEQFSALAHAADLADVSMQDLQSAMGKLAKAQGEALSSTSAQAKMFDALGISAKNADGSLRNTTDVFLDFADKFQKFNGSPEIMAAGMQLFGRSFQNLIPLLKDGSAGLRDAMEEAKALGLVLSTEAGANAEQFNDNLSRLKTLASGLGMSLASELLPRMVAFTDNAVEMVKAAGGAEGIMRKLSSAFDTMLTVAKAAGVYIGTAYAASIGIAAARMIAAAAATGTWTAATLGLTGAMTALRTAAAFLFGPVGLIAAGATGLYLLATRETEAEKAADAHKAAMDRLNGAIGLSGRQLLSENQKLREQTLLRLGLAQSVLAEAQARAVAAQKRASLITGEGRANGPALADAQARNELAQQQALVNELKREISEFDAQRQRMIEKNSLMMAVNSPGHVQDSLNLPGDSEDKLNKTRDEMARWRDEIEKTRAQLEGPLSVAELEHKKRLDEITVALKAGTITEVQATEARAQADEQYRRQTEEIEKNIAAQRERADVMGRLRSGMQEEVRLSAMSSEQRRVEEKVLRAMADAKQHNVEISEAEARAVVAAADAQIRANEDHIRSLEDLQQAGVGAFQRMAQAMGDFVGRGFRGVKDMWSQIKDAFRRGVADVISIMINAKFVQPIQNWLSQLLGIGAGQPGMQAQQMAQGGLGQILNSGFDRLLSGFTSLFSRGGPAADALQTATQAGFQAAKAAGLAVVPAGPVGGLLLPNGQLVSTGGGSLFGGMGTFAGVLGGAAMGWGMGGDTLGKIGGGLAGGALAYSLLGVGGGLAGLSAGMAAGGLFGGLSGMLGAMGPIGWVALGAIALNSISGGKLFGTSFKPESASQQWSVSGAGASGSQSVTEVRQRSFFRGREWRTTTSALDAEAMAAVNELFAQLQKTVQTAAQQLGIAVPEIVGGTFKREFDKNGNLTREFGTIAGRVYNEAQEAFAARLVGENMLAVAKAAGSAAELEQLANAYRGTGEQLQAFAALALSIQEDLLNANGIWKQVDGDGVMTRIVHYIEGMAKAGESLADAYARIQQAITQYGDLIGGVRAQIATRGLNQYQKAQLEVELAYRQQVKQANDLAKALGLSGARAEDLAAIEQLRALNMADLAQQYAAQQKQNDQWLQDLALSNLSPLTDAQKLSKAMELLQASVADGDIQRSQKLAEQVLGLGRNLYASGEDYNALYAQVTALVGDLSTQSMEELQGLTNEQLANLADLVSGLPAQIAQALAALLVAPPPPVSGTTEQPVPLPPTPTPVPPPPSGGGGGGGYSDGGACVAAHMWMDDGTRAADADAGNVHGTHDPVEGFARHSIRVRGMAVLQPCVRLVTASGAALVCSASTPFTAVDAPADLPEYTALAPDMLGREVIVSRGGLALVERVVSVQDAGQQLVVPLDFGGRSFAAGEDSERGLIYSHNMQKAPAVMVGEPNPYGAQMVGLLSEIASTNAEMARRDAAAELNALNAGSSLSSVY